MMGIFLGTLLYPDKSAGNTAINVQQNEQIAPNTNKRSSGQMTIEFVIMFPVMLMIALIACNSVLFLCECSAFDRVFRESVCVYAPSPASDETPERTCAMIASTLEPFEQRSYLSCSVESSSQTDGLTTYSAVLEFTPTIFGAYPLRRVLDVDLPPIEHSIQLRVDTYKPGVFL